jgi:hypothetical protein
MKMRRIRIAFLVSVLVVGACGSGSRGGPGGVGLNAIRAEDMTFHLKFLSAEEFRGRNTPSVELDIASKYIALTAEKIGLKPLMDGESYYQEVPVDVTSVSRQGSRLRLLTGRTEQIFYFPQSFGASRYTTEGSVAGEIVFLGYGLGASELGWDDYADRDVKGKIVVILDAALPEDHVLKPGENRRLLRIRASSARGKGAAAVVTIINEERESRLAERDLSFDVAERLRFPDIVTGTGAVPGRTSTGGKPAAPPNPFFQIEVRRAVGAALLGIEPEELAKMSDMIRRGQRVAPRSPIGKRLEVSIAVETRKKKTLNVVGYVEGNDPNLKDEYVVIGSHHDHLAPREGRIYPGSDDNNSGVVGMFEIAEAVMARRPKRSVIFVWHTAEEKGLIGAYYFVQHCPVPVEKISANINLDMISRNKTDHIYLIGSNKLSSELDESIEKMNERGIGFELDYTYEDPGHPDRFFFRSDQYPYIRYGIPGVWFFCGTTEDYHTPGDIEEKADYEKLEKVAKLAYLVTMDIGNKPEMLKLDLHPDITGRGPENMKINWRRAQERR